MTLTRMSLDDFCRKLAQCLVGQWRSVGFDVSAADLDLTSPISVHWGPVNVAEPAGSVGGGAVGKPDLTTCSYTCRGNELVSYAPPGSGISGSWTLTRVGNGWTDQPSR